MMRKGETHTDEKQINRDYIIMNGDAMGEHYGTLFVIVILGSCSLGKKGGKSDCFLH